MAAESRASEESTPLSSGPKSRRWNLARVGWLTLPFFGTWFVGAFLVPSPTGAFVPALPLVAFLLAASAFLWAFGLIRRRRKWNARFRRTAVVGLAAGLVFTGAMSAVALASGCPFLAPFPTAEPGGWSKVAGAPWQDGGHPVLFFYGSVACPFCSATSWALWKALTDFGNLSNVSFGYSSPTDVHPNTPEVVLAGTGYASPFIATDIREDTDPTTVRAPVLGSCTELAYTNSYGGGIVPFLVVGGTFVRANTLVDPATLQGLTTAQVAQQVVNGSGPAWQSIAPATFWLEAFLEKSAGGAPAAVVANPSVHADLLQVR
ncbi:MAG TPA: DUF929 family protein [Thermoplasmata archaeon]|nr:DUF929 family protein [Thermoplasmata archaeon]